MPTPMPDDEIRAGKLFQGDYQYEVKSSAGSLTSSGDGDPTYGHGAELYSLFTPNAIDLALGAYLSVSSSFDGTNGTWSAFYDGPCAPFGGLGNGGSTYQSSVKATATFKNLRLYAMEYGLLRVMFDGVDVDLGGTVTSLGPSVDAESAGIGPNYIPVFGIPPTVSGGCSAGRTNLTPWAYDPCNPDNADGRDWSTALGSTVSGGWRYRETSLGPWIDCPVTPYAGSADRTYGDLADCSASASYGFSYNGRVFLEEDFYAICPSTELDVPGTSVYMGRFPARGQNLCTGEIGPAYSDVYRTDSESSSSGGSITLILDFGAGFKRFAPGFAKLLRRLWFPATTATVTDFTSDTVGGVTSTVDNGHIDAVHPALGNDYLGLLRDSDADVLDFLDTPPFAPSGISTTSSSSVNYGYVETNILNPPEGITFADIRAACGNPGGPVGSSGVTVDYAYDNESHTASSGTSFPSSVGPSGDYQGHAEPLARYCATWPNPFWHLFDHRQDWSLQGANAPWAPVDDEPGYWGPIRDQWLSNSEIEDLPKTRSHMIGSPYYDWAYTPIFDNFTGGLPWSGITRWKVREVGFPELVTLTNASEPMFSCPDDSCEVSVSGGLVTIVPSGSGLCVVDIDLVRADCFPFYGLLLAKKVKLGTYTNAGSVTASLRSSFGGSVALNDGNPLTSGTEYQFPRGTDSGFAGTWGSEDGGGYLPDQGTDVAPGGDSVGHMSNPETLAGFQGVRGLQGSVLRLTITPTDPDDPVTIGLPTFRRFQGHPQVRWLDGNKAVLFWPDGPAILWGGHLTYVPDVGLFWPWQPKGLGTPNTLADALQFIYAIFEMTDPGDVPAFDAEVVGWYDDFEVSLANVGSADKFSFSLLLPKGTGEKIRFAIAQTVAEVPPLACFPFPKWNVGTWTKGDPGMERWDQSQEKDYIVSPVSALVLKNAGGTTLSTSSATVSGWAVQEYTLALDGDEADDFALFAGSDKISTLYPWRGWYWIGGSFQGGKTPFLLPLKDGRVYQAYGSGATIRVQEYWHGGQGAYRHDSEIDPEGFRPRLATDPRDGTLIVQYERSGERFQRASRDGGRSWTTEIDMGTGYRPEPATSHLGHLASFHIEELTGGEFQVYSAYRTDAPGLVYSTPVAVTDQSGDPITCSLEGWGGCIAPWHQEGGWLLSIVPFGESSPVLFHSRERKALTFKRL